MNNSRSFSLIIPAAADKSEYADRMPSIFTMDEEGIMRCVRSILGLNLEVFDRIYFTILRKHAERYDIDVLLELQLRRLGLNTKTEIVILDEPTSTQAETIAKTIERKEIEGAIFIKDADCYFRAEVYPENGVAVYPLEELELVDPRNKSYVAVDDMNYVTNIIEKRVIGHLFNAGGYCFEEVKDFLNVYGSHKQLGPVYLSHLIYALLLEANLFRPIKVSNYLDWSIKR